MTKALEYFNSCVVDYRKIQRQKLKSGRECNDCRRLLTIACAIVSLGGCVPRPESEVVIYSAADREFAAPILGAFERRAEKTKVSSQFDVESSKTVGLVNRLIGEKAHPRCDVFWNNEIMHTLRLESLGLLERIEWQVPSDWPTNMRSTTSTWIGFAARARILVVNRQMLPDKSQWPKSVLELADPKWKGKCGVALPLFGTTATHFTVLDTKLGPTAAAAWFQKVKSNAVVLSGNKQVAQSVSAGQLVFGLTDTDDALVEIDNGLDVGIVFPDQDSGELGSLLIPNTVCIIKNSPNPVAARLLSNYLLSEDVEGRLAMGVSGQFPMRPNHPQKSRAQKSETVRWMEVDFLSASLRWPEVAEKLREVFVAQVTRP